MATFALNERVKIIPADRYGFVQQISKEGVRVRTDDFETLLLEEEHLEKAELISLDSVTHYQKVYEDWLKKVRLRWMTILSPKAMEFFTSLEITSAEEGKLYVRSMRRKHEIRAKGTSLSIIRGSWKNILTSTDNAYSTLTSEKPFTPSDAKALNEDIQKIIPNILQAIDEITAEKKQKEKECFEKKFIGAKIIGFDPGKQVFFLDNGETINVSSEFYEFKEIEKRKTVGL